MIRLTRVRDQAHLKGFAGPDLQKKLEKLLNYYYSDSGRGVDFKDKSRHVWGKAKASLKIESHNKCAYCEASTAAVAYGDVEHFRPKDHYWWLAYCYDNFTFSCQICNQVYKGAKFPIDGLHLEKPQLPQKFPSDPLKFSTYATSLSPDPFASSDIAISQLFGNEAAHLPHPYIDKPEKLFAWKVIKSTGEVYVVPRKNNISSQKAVKAAEDVLGINRAELLQLRYIHYEFIEMLALTLQDAKPGARAEQRILTRIQRMSEDKQPFAGMKRFFLRKWGLIN